MSHTIQADVWIENTPESVINFISDIRNREKYQQSLKSITDIQGEPGQIGSTWRWKWDLMGNEFEGLGRCVEYDPGQRYSFVTEGGLVSRFTYHAEPENGGTKLTVNVDFDVPEVLLEQVGLDNLLSAARQRGKEAVQNLKSMLEG